MKITFIYLLVLMSTMIFLNDYSFCQIQDTTVYTTVDSLPEFRFKDCKDTKSSLKLYMTENKKWPGDDDFEGTIYILCVVEKDGRLTNFKILKQIEEKFDKTSLNLVKLMPNWIPGSTNGKIVRSQLIIPVKWMMH
jgi:hypothetical protein